MKNNDPETPLCDDLLVKYGHTPNEKVIVVDIPLQQLVLLQNRKELVKWPISTSKFGPGNERDSYKTPTGVHRIAEKIGAKAPSGTVFKGRVGTGQTINEYADDESDDMDLVTSRILWLEGMEPGINQGPGVDSFERYIYIHGTDEENSIGTPASIGCIRMRNADVIELFDQVDTGTLVSILATRTTLL